MTPRFGEPPRKDVRYQTRHGAYVVLPRGRDLLLTHQTHPTPEFQLPGGGIDPGESALQALHREVLEETGWRIAHPVRLGVFRRFTFMPEYGIWAEKICHVFKARPVRPLHEPLEPGHLAVWMNGTLALRALGNDGDRHYAARALSDAG